MSAADKFFELGSGTKDLAIGIGILLAVAGVVYFLVKGPAKAGAAAGAAAGGAVGGAVGGAITGTVKGVATGLGVPDTNVDQCSQDLAAGDHWAASFSCPASRFLGAVFGGGSSSPSAPAASLPDLVPAILNQDVPNNDPSQFSVSPSIFGSGS